MKSAILSIVLALLWVPVVYLLELPSWVWFFIGLLSSIVANVWLMRRRVK